MTEEPPNPDWDGLFTLALALFVCVMTAGIAYLFWLHRVVGIARAQDGFRERGPDPDACLVVPGKRLIANRPDADFRQRLQRAAELSAPPFRGRIVLLGGTTAGARISEAEAGRDYLQALKTEAPPRILLEAESRNTLTNLRNLRDLLQRPDGDPATMILVSNRYHLARIALIASSLRIPHRLAAAEARLDDSPRSALNLARESLFCLWFVVGKGWASITRNRRMLARVT